MELQGVKWGDRGLREVTRNYTGLEAVTGGYKELKGVTCRDMRLQR